MQSDLTHITRFLVPILRDKVVDLRDSCATAGVGLLVYCGARSAEDQARLYRRSRTLEQIKSKAASLDRKGFPELASTLIGVGPQSGKLGQHVTNAGPGESWHQYGEAIDAAPTVSGKPIWDEEFEGWQVYGAACKRYGLVWAGTWKNFKEYPHAQLRTSGNPLDVLSPSEVADTILWR